jgi:Secreted repeat of unknown function
VLGRLLAQAFEGAGWAVIRAGRRPDPGAGFRHVDLDEAGTVAAATGEADVVVNVVPDPGLTAERMVLDRGGMLINLSAMPAEAGRRLRQEARTARGTVVMNAGIAPGVTNLIAADLLATHPEADEVELAFTVSTKSPTGPAGGDFAHRNLTTVSRHRTKVIPLPAPFGMRRCPGFAEPDGGWLGGVVGDRVVSPYVCIAERTTHRAMLACTGDCASAWPPLKLQAGETAAAGAGVSAGQLGTTPDPGGGRVVTYDGWPLYTYVRDASPGHAAGQGKDDDGGYWYAIRPSGQIVSP